MDYGVYGVPETFFIDRKGRSASSRSARSPARSWRSTSRPCSGSRRESHAALTTRLGLALVALLVADAPFAPTLGAAPVSEEAVHEVTAQLRCVVCQSLSVADSPSETAHQMRAIIRERLAAGETADQVRGYFVGR